jgi:hypothetical protein
MHDMFAVVESEGVDLFDPNDGWQTSQFQEMRDESVSLMNKSIMSGPK